VYKCNCVNAVDEFDDKTQELLFGPNQTVASVMIQTNHDLILEDDEEFYIKLVLTEESETIGVKLEEPNVATVTIINTNGTIHTLPLYYFYCIYSTSGVFVGLTSSEYFTVEDSGVMTVGLQCDKPANISFTVTLQLTMQTASGVVNILCMDIYTSFFCF